MNVVRFRHALMLLAGALILLPGCHSQPSPEAQVRLQTNRFISAMERNDMIELNRSVTGLAVTRGGAALLQPGASKQKPELARKSNPDIAVTTIRLKDSTAEADATVAGSTEIQCYTVKLRNEEGQWKVYALDIKAVGSTMVLTMDFEHPENFESGAMESAGKLVGETLGKVAQGTIKGFQAAGDSYQKGVSEAKPAAAP